jgi:uncharacterized SAM-binding protein YcdF (DUF218 family)
MKRAFSLVCFLAAVLLIGYLFRVAHEIEEQSTVDETQPADVIMILGAAEYHGKPSPVLQARLNHGLLLYLQRQAPYVLTTGGSGGDPDFTESEVGRNYMMEHGVPPEAILTEQGSTTAQSVDAAAETMHRMNLHSCIVVSDGYHIYRVKRLMQAHGIKVFGSPRPQTGKLSQRQRNWLYFKQAAGFVLWQAGINI